MDPLEPAPDTEVELLPLFSDDLGYRCPNGRTLRLLRRQYPSPDSARLFADNLWPGSRAIADYLFGDGMKLCHNKSVVELGAGCALPSLVAYSCGASCLTVVRIVSPVFTNTNPET